MRGSEVRKKLMELSQIIGVCHDMTNLRDEDALRRQLDAIRAKLAEIEQAIREN